MLKIYIANFQHPLVKSNYRPNAQTKFINFSAGKERETDVVVDRLKVIFTITIHDSTWQGLIV